MILDIRKEQKEEITGIKFDDSPDIVHWDQDGFYLKGGGEKDVRFLCFYRDFDNFIAALHKAKELVEK